ncbi:MAG TPA: VOC family protein [Acidimicrobiales bacterium]|nr:VOC family protein [Acidimicrobiales bacterium]
MPSREKAPIGAPCWTDLWTSDVEVSRRFYSELFGWRAEEPNAEFGGYFMFSRAGVPVAGGMGDMGDMRANDTWKVFLASDDIARTADAAASSGARIAAPPMAVDDLGSQFVLVDPTGAEVGVWQAGTFPGFTVLAEHGAPSWFELLTRDHAAAVAFYRTVFGWDTSSVGDSDEFRYTTMRDPSGEGELAGIMDASASLPSGAPAQWVVYWDVDDISVAIATVRSLDGSVVTDVEDTPYGLLATVADPLGAQFKLHATASRAQS